MANTFKKNNEKIEINKIETETETENKNKNKNDNKNNGFFNSSSGYMKGVTILIIGQILIKVLGLVYRIVLLNIEGFTDETNGYYASGYELYALLLTFSSLGLPNIISKMVSERIGKNDKSGAQRIFKWSMIIYAGFGILMSAILFFFSKEISVGLYKIENVKYVLKVLAPAIMFVSASSILRGYFNGLGDMKPGTISQTFEQLLNCVFTIFFAYLAIGQPPHIMAAAANLSTTFAVIISFSYLIYYYRKYRLKIEIEEKNNELDNEDKLYLKSNFEVIKMILALTIPVTLATVISSIYPVIDNTTIVNGVKAIYEGSGMAVEEINKIAMSYNGIISKINTLTSLPQSINFALAIGLVPAISHAIAKKNKKDAKERYTQTIKTSLLVTIPAYLGMFVLSSEILTLLFPASNEGGELFKILVFPAFFVTITAILNSVLNAFGKVNIPLFIGIFGVSLKYILNNAFIRIPELNIFGAGISTFISQLFVMVVSIIFANKYLKPKQGFGKDVFKILISAIVMAIFTYLFNNLLVNSLNINGRVITMISIIFAALIYLVSLVVFKAISREDIESFPGGNKILRIFERLKINI